ncbi:MAG: AAA family ATPase [Bacteroidales bacterium]|nr:AAA family ATPase [Bacteroidales bacterium]
MDERSLYQGFVKLLAAEPTACQDSLFRDLAQFLLTDDGDIFVVNGYAGTGKTSALSAVVSYLKRLGIKSVLLAPTGRAAKVLSGMSGFPASTVHKHIYRQKSVGKDGYGQFSLAPNKAKYTLFVVDEVSLVGMESLQQGGGAVFGTGNLLEDLVAFVRSGNDCRLILTGDGAQLPPIGLESSPALTPECMDNFGGVRYATLSTVVRQAEGSGILSNATMLRNKIVSAAADDTFEGPLLDVRNCPDVKRIGGGELIEAISDAYSKYGYDSTIVLTRSNKRAIRYNLGIRAKVLYKEEEIARGDKFMIVKNCYQFLEDVDDLDYIANGDVAILQKIWHYEDRYGLRFADALLQFPDYDDCEVKAKVCLDTLTSESASLTYEQQNALYAGVSADYADRGSKKKIWEAVREDPYFNALQLKYADAITCHKAQGGQWDCVFIDNPFWQEMQTTEDLKWLYTALTRAVKQVYLVNFKDSMFV